MADIAKCKGEGCYERVYCHRHTAPDNEWQQNWIVTPTERPCPMFWGNAQHDLVQQLEKIVRGEDA